MSYYIAYPSEEMGDEDWVVRLRREEFETLLPFAESIERAFPAGILERERGVSLDWKAVLHARRLMRKVDGECRSDRDWGLDRTVEPRRSTMQKARALGRVLTVIA